MVSELGLLDGLTATGIILSATIFGFLSLYKSIKLKAKLLTIAAITMFFVGFLWLGPTIDFFMVLITKSNLPNDFIYTVLSYTWVAPALVVAMYLGSSLMAPKRKWIVVGIFIALGIVFEYFLWFQNDASFRDLPMPILGSGDLIDARFETGYYTFFLIAIFLLASLILLGIGFFIKAKQATGELRKKFIYLGVGFTIFVVCGALDSILTIPVAIGVVRVVMMTFALWMYLGLKT
ncbi:MAG: hypothetical protein MUP85_23625 [Candidatus Lokiarchaeota archaeon]|nr:hypothetical protein [Candidatus Lokiarchaeota archaeon]